MELSGLMCSIEEVVAKSIKEEDTQYFLSLMRTLQLFTIAQERNWDSWSWKRCHDEKQLCLDDYTRFNLQTLGLYPPGVTFED